jgi:ethanolamine permease
LLKLNSPSKKIKLKEETIMENDKNTISRILGPMHVWALGVGIVLVGEFMGWNFTIARGGSIGSIIAVWTIAIMYIAIVMMTNEISSVMPEAGGQYTMAKFLLGPLAAFNVGLMAVLEYAMLEAADVVVVGDILKSLNPAIKVLPFIILSLIFLTWMNYRGVYATLTLNFIITAAAFLSVMVLLFATNFYDPDTTLIKLKQMTDGLPYGFLGVLAAMQFAIWFFLGIEGTAMAATECRSAERSLPLGSIIGLLTLLIGATVTWYVCSGLINTKTLGVSPYPLYDAAAATGKLYVVIALFVGTLLSCLASANGCINDASRAWSALSSDAMLPDVFAKIHPKYNTPYRSILFLLPISTAFAFTGMLDQIITFSIFSALLIYILTAFMMLRFRKMYPLKTIDRGYIAPIHPIPAIVTVLLACAALFGMSLTYGINIILGIIFYSLASLWFVKRRYKYINQNEFLKNGIEKWGIPHF